MAGIRKVGKVSVLDQKAPEKASVRETKSIEKYLPRFRST